MALKISDYIPAELLKDIQKHLRRRGNAGHGDFLDNQADEDSITGALGSRLRRGPTDRFIDGQHWQWRVSSKKFVGKGKRAQEPVIGADAIIEFTLENRQGQAITKSLLFQAKKRGSQQELRDQVGKMEGVAKGCSAIIDYSEDAYRALDGTEYLESPQGRDGRNARRHGQQLGDYLAEEFLACNVGIAGMSYDAVGRELRVPSDRVGSISVPAELRNRIRITTVGPVQLPP